MRSAATLPVLAIAVAALAAHPRPAAAISACSDNIGESPAAKQTLPPRPRIILYADRPRSDDKITATIDGKPVKTKISHVKSAPYDLTIVQIDSDATGTLVIGPATYTIAKTAAMPKEIAATVARYHREYQHSTVKELYDGLALVLPDGTPAISAHLKVRRDDKATWSELDVPITAAFQTHAPQIWLGELGCERNYTVALLEAGIDLEVTVTLVDGTTRKLTGVPAHVKLPAL